MDDLIRIFPGYNMPQQQGWSQYQVQYPHPQQVLTPVVPVEVVRAMQECYECKIKAIVDHVQACLKNMACPKNITTTQTVAKVDHNECKLYCEHYSNAANGIGRKYTRDICKGIPVEVNIVIYDPKYHAEDCMQIKFRTKEGEKYVVILQSQLSSRHFARAIKNGGAAICESSMSEIEIATLIAGYIFENLKPGSMFIPYNSGWHLGESIEFCVNYGVCNSALVKNSGYFNNILNIDSGIKEAAALQQLANNTDLFRDAGNGYILILFLILSIVRTILNEYNTALKKILVFTGDFSDKATIIYQFFEIYNTKNRKNYVASDEDTIKNKVFNSKDDIIIFSETSKKGREETKAKDMLIDMVVKSSAYTYKNNDEYILESTVAIINDRILYEHYSSDNFIVFPITQGNVNEKNIRHYNPYTIPTFINYFTKYIKESNIDYKEVISKATEEAEKRFASYETQNMFILLHCASELLENYSKAVCAKGFTELCELTEDINGIIEKFVIFNDEYNNFEDASVEFLRTIDDYVSKNPCIIFDDYKGELLVENQDENCPIIYKKKKSIYISMDDLKKYFFVDERRLCLYLDAMKKQGYLNVNYGVYTSRPTLHYHDPAGKREAMVEMNSDLFSFVKNI